MILKGLKCKENIPDNFLVTFWHFYPFQFTSVQFNLFYVLNFDSLQLKWNLIPWKISVLCESLPKVLKTLKKLSSYEIFIIT